MAYKDFNDRISWDFDGVCSEIESVLDEMRVQRSNKLFAKPLGNKYISRLKTQEENVKKKLYDAFQLVIIGDFKRGKSTLINALLGEYVVPTAVTPETVTINKLSYGDTEKIEAVTTTKKRVALSIDELPREKIESLLEHIPGDIDYVDIKIKNELLKDVMIVDTPGIGESMRDFDKQIAEYLVNADAVVYVMSARSPMSASEQSFLSNIVMPQSFSRVLVALNMVDTLDSIEDITKVTNLLEQKVADISDKIYVYPVSALDEYARKVGKRRPNDEMYVYLEDYFNDFENALKEDIIMQKDVIKSVRGIELARAMLGELKAHIRLSQQALSINIDDLKKIGDSLSEENHSLFERINKEKDELAVTVMSMSKEAQAWMKAFLARLKNEIQSLNSTSFKELQRYLQFYISDMIKEATLACIECHQKELKDIILEKSNDIYSDTLNNAIKTVDNIANNNMGDVTWTGIDEALNLTSFIANEFFTIDPTGLLVTAYNFVFHPLAQIIAGYARKSTVENKQKDIITPLVAAFPQIEENLMESITDIYTKISITMQDNLTSFYQQQVDMSSEAIENARRAVEDEDLRVQDIEEQFNDVLDVIEECDKRLAQLL